MLLNDIMCILIIHIITAYAMMSTDMLCVLIRNVYDTLFRDMMYVLTRTVYVILSQIF